MNVRTIILRSNQVSPDSRVEKESSSLKKGGYNVKIVCWDRRYNHKEIVETENFFGEKIPIVRFGHRAKFGEGMKSLKQFVAFQKNLFKWLFLHRKEFDIIHACDFDTAFVATIANLLIKKKFIFDIFDYIAGERRTIKQKLLCRAQNWIIGKADATIICTEDRRNQIKDSIPNKLVVIHNSPPKINFIKQKEAIKSDKIKICYVGILQDYRLLKDIPEFFIHNPNYELHIGGFGKYEEYYKNLSNKYKNIIYYGKLQYQDTLELEKKCDIMLAIYDPSIENHKFAAPNKFYEGLMLGKPLIMVKKTGMSSIVENYGIGETIEYSIEGFKEGIMRLTERQSEWASITENMKKLYNEFSWEEMENRLLKLYFEICEN